MSSPGSHSSDPYASSTKSTWSCPSEEVGGGHIPQGPSQRRRKNNSRSLCSRCETEGQGKVDCSCSPRSPLQSLLPLYFHSSPSISLPFLSIALYPLLHLLPFPQAIHRSVRRGWELSAPRRFLPARVTDGEGRKRSSSQSCQRKWRREPGIASDQQQPMKKRTER